MKPPAFENFSASIPWEGVAALSSHWAGAGTLYDWVRPEEFEIVRDWVPEVVRARMVEAALLHIQTTFGKHLPRHAGEWLDLIGQQTRRAVEHADTPSAHTDWQATIAVFGRYPSESYIEKRPVYTHDTSFTRLLKWTAMGVARAESLVWAQFGRHALEASTRQRFSTALELPEVATAANEYEGLSDYDRAACREAGGVWLVLARIADMLRGLWIGSASAQLLALRPILPNFAHQLFELGTLGTISARLRKSTTQQMWTSRAPLAAAHGGRPSLSLDAEQGDWHAFYQTVPQRYRKGVSPYMSVTKDLAGAPLRPDIWIEQNVAGIRTELVVECKYSLSPSYVSTGVTQCFAYEVEFPPQDGARRIHVVVGPEEVVQSPRSWDNRFAVAAPSTVSELCKFIFAGQLDKILTEWEK